MYGCSTHRAEGSGVITTPANGGLALRIEDMICGNYAGVIKKAVESALPGAHADADPVSELVWIRRTEDLPSARAIANMCPPQEPEPWNREGSLHDRASVRTALSKHTFREKHAFLTDGRYPCG